MTTEMRKMGLCKRRRAWACGLLCLGLLAGILPARAAESEPGPKVTVEVTRIAATRTLEVGLNVTASEFKSMGAILRFDTSKLTLVQWDTAATPVAPAQGVNWDHYSIVPAKGADEAGAKPAVAYVDSTDPTHAFVYFGADAFGVLPELTDRRLVTLRFDFVGTEEEKTALYEGLKTETLGGYLNIADDAAAIYSMAGAAVQCITETGAGDQTAYRYCPVELDEAGKPVPESEAETDLSLQLDARMVLDLDGESQMGTTVTAEACAVTFLDWDGSILATAAVPRKEDISGEIEALEGKPGLKEALTGKPGYDFDCWLDYGAETKPFTSNALSVKGAPGVVDFTKTGSLIKAPYYGITVQAAYRTNDAVNNGQGPDASLVEDQARYTMTEPTFYQYGASLGDSDGQYAVRCTVERGSVLRAVEPVARAQVYVGEGEQMSMVTVKADLKNTDSASFEVVVPKSVTRVSFALLDTDGLEAWTMGRERSRSGGAEQKEIISGGAFALIVDRALSAGNGGAWGTEVNARCFRDAGYPGVTEDTLAAAQTLLANASAERIKPLDRAEVDTLLSSYR